MTIDHASDGRCPHCNDDNNHHHVSCDGLATGIAFVATKALPCAGALLMTVATLSTYARLAYSLYADHFLHVRLASAHPIREVVKQLIYADSVRAHPGTNGSGDGHAGTV